MKKNAETEILEEQWTETIKQGSFGHHASSPSFDEDSNTEDTPDASFVTGWNSIADIVQHEDTGFDPVRYLQGVTEAIDEYCQQQAEQAHVMAAHHADIQSISEAWTRLQSAGIRLTTYGGGLGFKQKQGNPHVYGPKLDCWPSF